MRILHVTSRVSCRGGADHYLRSLIEHQQATHQVFLAAGHCDEDTEAPCPLQLIENLDAVQAAPVDIEPLLIQWTPDIIHLHNVMNPVALKQLAGQRAVITVQDHRVFCPGSGKWTLQGEACHQPMSKQQCADCFTSTSYFEKLMAITRARLETLHAFPITVLSKYMKEELVTVGLSAERIHVIGPFVHDLPRVEAGPRDRILFVGRLTRAKGVHAAASAWRKSGVGEPLVFAGTGSERNQLEANGFEVTGWLNRQALSEQYSRAAAVIMPSYWQEPYGIVGLEAASLGIPVVTWRSGGIPEWSSPEFTVDWGDIDQLAACLKKAVAGSTVAHKAVNPDIAMAQLLSLYEDMVQGSYGR